jgi:hypothetical protein
MSNTAKTDEIDELVSTVRNFVAHKEQQKAKAGERLVLMPGQRIGADATEDAAKAGAGVADASNVLILETDHPADREGLEATIAELEAAVTAQSDDWEPDGGENFDKTSSWATSAFETPVEDSVAVATAHLEKVNIPTMIAQAEDKISADIEETVISDLAAGVDMDALRALVVATVHEELGGDLGERITQNVRKLVRREINRVLASYDMNPD